MDTKFRDPNIFQGGEVTEIDKRLQIVERHEQGNKVNLVFEMELTQDNVLHVQQWNTIGAVTNLQLSGAFPFLYFRVPADISVINDAMLSVWFAPFTDNWTSTTKQSRKAFIILYDASITAYPKDIATSIGYYSNGAYPTSRDLAGQSVFGTNVPAAGGNYSMTKLISNGTEYQDMSTGIAVDVFDPAIHDVSAQFGAAAGTYYSASFYGGDLAPYIQPGKDYAVYIGTFDLTSGYASGVNAKIEINGYTKNR